MYRFLVPTLVLALVLSVSLIAQSGCEEDADGDGWTTEDGDCNDGNPDIHPGAEEICDNADNDCDGYTDDADQDGFRNEECGGHDCDDTDASVHPEATETCDGQDTDCDGTVDNAEEQTWFRDTDGDGYGDSDIADVLVGCDIDGWSLEGSDCDDDDSEIYPNAMESCDGEDNDCDGEIDEGTVGEGNGAECPAYSCLTILELDPDAESGLYWVDPLDIGEATEVYCDMSTDGGGWMLLGKTVNSSLTSDERDLIHYGTWEDYSSLGYGAPDTDAKVYWAPLTLWHGLTSTFPYNVLAIDDSSNDIRMVDFSVSDADSKHVISWSSAVDGYGQIVTGVKSVKFTTYDSDNDTWGSNCAKDNVGYNGGWWYTDCYQLSMLHSNNNLYSWVNNIDTVVDYMYIWFREE